MTSAPIANGDFTPILGSDLYYATLYVPAPQRRALSLIEALRAQIAAVPFTVSNPELAFTKLSWWHEEAHRLNANEARHALTRALAPVQNAYPQLGPAMLALIDGILALQQTGRFATSDERFAGKRDSKSA